MITRGYILVSHPLDKVHDAVLETCKEMNAEVRDIKKNSNASYQIEVETASIFDKAFRGGHRFQIRLQDKQPKTLIDVYDFYFLPETETKFIFPFFRGLTKHLRLDSGFRIYPVEAPTTSSMPTYAVAEHNRKLVVSPILMERFDYDVTIINDGGVSEVKNSERLSIDLVEGGSVVSLIRGSKVLFTVPIRDIVEQTILNMEPETT